MIKQHLCAILVTPLLVISASSRAQENTSPLSDVAWGQPDAKTEIKVKPRTKPKAARALASANIRHPPLHSGPPQPKPFPPNEETQAASTPSPFDLSLSYKGEVNRVLSGGVQRKSEYLGVLDLRAGVDLDRLIAWKGGKAYFDVLGTHGGHPSENVGDVQVTSNLDAPTTTLKLYEAWVSQALFEDKVSLLAGFHDLNTEFYVTETSGLFLNSSFGVGKDLSQSGQNGPSIFPSTSPALRLRVDPNPSFYAQIGIFAARAGDPEQPHGTQARIDSKDGAFQVAEAGYVRGRGDGNKLYGKYALGAWGYTRTFDHQTQTLTNADGEEVPVQAASHGFYLLSEQALNDTFAVFFRYGVASTEVNAISSGLGSGVAATGLLPGRDKDRLGFGIAHITFGDEYKSALQSEDVATGSSETSLELTYRAEVLPFLSLQPDLQYVISPSADPTIPNAWVGALRFEINL